MKTRIIIWLVLLCLIGGMWAYASHEHTKAEQAVAAELITQEQLNQATQDAIMYQTNLSLLGETHNSTVQQLLEARKEIKVKDNKIKYLLGMENVVYINDTAYIPIHDTTVLSYDTTFRDSIWYSTHVSIDSSKLTVNTTMKSQLSAIIYQTKEYVPGPDPCWFKRLFQRKHIITRVHIKEANPYIVTDSNNVFIHND